MRVQSLGREDPLEEGMATHSSILPGESHGQRSLVGYSPQSCKESKMTEVAKQTAKSNSSFQYGTKILCMLKCK